LLGKVDALWRYPASSLAGEQLDEIAVAGDGVVGDRKFGVIEVATGESGRPDADRKWHKLPLIRTRSTGEGLEVAVPGGRWLAAPDDEVDRSLSDFMGFAVSLRPFSREVAPGYAGPLTASRYNVTPIHLLTTASLARLKQLHPEGVADARRFRPNIVVDMPAVDGHFPETEWIGRKLSIGEVELTISEPCRRCGFTIIGQDGFGEDPEILRQLVRNNQRNIGVYCTVDRPGSIALGASMQFA
jgi:uncharacterized protein YcbX